MEDDNLHKNLKNIILVIFIVIYEDTIIQVQETKIISFEYILKIVIIKLK